MTAASYAWRRLDLDGLGFVRLEAHTDTVSAMGHEVCADGPDRWAVRFAVIEALDLAGTRAVQLTSDGGGTWTRDGRPDPALDGCTDVDIAGNPFTNAFVTRRVALEIGTETEVRAAFVEPPGLSVRPLVQRYRRLESDRWQYGDDEYGTFEFTTDADGVAVHYERLAERIS